MEEYVGGKDTQGIRVPYCEATKYEVLLFFYTWRSVLPIKNGSGFSQTSKEYNVILTRHKKNVVIIKWEKMKTKLDKKTPLWSKLWKDASTPNQGLTRTILNYVSRPSI